MAYGGKMTFRVRSGGGGTIHDLLVGAWNLSMRALIAAIRGWSSGAKVGRLLSTQSWRSAKESFQVPKKRNRRNQIESTGFN